MLESSSVSKVVAMQAKELWYNSQNLYKNRVWWRTLTISVLGRQRQAGAAGHWPTTVVKLAGHRLWVNLCLTPEQCHLRWTLAPTCTDRHTDICKCICNCRPRNIHIYSSPMGKKERKKENVKPSTIINRTRGLVCASCQLGCTN